MARSPGDDTVLLLLGRVDQPGWTGGDGNTEGLDLACEIGSGDRLRDRRCRERERDRARTDWAMAPKNDRSVGEFGDADEVEEVGEIGEKYEVGAPALVGGDRGVVEEAGVVELVNVAVIVLGVEGV